MDRRHDSSFIRAAIETCIGGLDAGGGLGAANTRALQSIPVESAMRALVDHVLECASESSIPLAQHALRNHTCLFCPCEGTDTW